jgi:hypothetical protein
MGKERKRIKNTRDSIKNKSELGKESLFIISRRKDK